MRISRRLLKSAVFSLCLAAAAFSATAPVQNMTTYSLAAEYYGSAQGHTELYQFDGASVAMHMLRLHYSPFRFLRFSAGLGGGVPYADPSIEGTDFGVATTGGVGLYLPLGFLSVTAGYDGYFTRSSEERHQIWREPEIRRNPITGLPMVNFDELGNPTVIIDSVYYRSETTGKTQVTFHTPYIGVVFHLGRYIDLELGGQYRYASANRSQDSLDRRMADDDWIEKDPTVTPNPGNFNKVISEQIRGYITLTFHEKESGAYLVGGASYAPALIQKREKDLDIDGQMYRFSAWGQLGIVMKAPNSGKKGAKTEYSDVYIDMLRRQESMAEALERDVEREMRRNVEEGRAENDFGTDAE